MPKDQQEKNLKILLFGHGTYLNRGCEAIVTGTAKSIKKYTKESSVSVATFDVKNDSSMHKELIDNYLLHRWIKDIDNKDELSKIKSFNSNSIEIENFLHKDVIKKIEGFDICLSVGGDNYCYGAPHWLYAIDNAVVKNKKRLILWGASIEDDIVDEKFIRDIRKFNLVLTRESLTYNLLSSYVDKKKLLLEPDIAFSLEKKETSLPKGISESRGIIALNISPLVVKYQGENGTLLNDVKKLIDYILEHYSFDILLLPHVYKKNNDDLETAKKIKQNYSNNKRVFILDEKKYSSTELKYIISKCKLLIASRTHASIAGYSTETPTLVLGYSIKSRGIAKDIFGNFDNYVIPVRDLCANNLIEKFEYILKNEVYIKKTLSKIIPEYKERASNLFEITINRLKENEAKDVTKKENCSGCSACASICPENAITMKLNKEGFSYPNIDKNKCVNCGACKTTCPNNNDYKNDFKKPYAYACKNLSKKERESSSSGGIFSLLAKETLKKQGCVFGATYEQYDVKHIKINSEEELNKLRGSKYVESSINKCYIEAKKELETGRNVLFSGVPCQIEGLKKFLKRDYPNLLCVSVVCHGVPSKKIFKSNLEELEKEHDDKIININFRNKEDGWQNYKVEYTFNKNSLKKSREDDPFMRGFSRNYFLRPSCYECNFRLFKKNTSDIMLGDFWGIEKEMKDFNDKRGISSAIINSKKGQEYFNKITKEIKKREVSIETLVKYNSCLIRPVEYNKKRFEFFDLFEKLGLKKTISIFDKDEELAKLESELQKIEKIINNEANLTAKNELNKILQSRKWKMITKSSHIFNKIFPHGTFRRKILRVSYKGLSRGYKKCIRSK